MFKSPRSRADNRLLAIISVALAFAVIGLVMPLGKTASHSELDNLLVSMDELKDVARQASYHQTSSHAPLQTQPRLLFYNRPPKTGSTTVRIAMKRALDDVGLKAAKCFNMIEWNEMGLKTIVTRRGVDFYGCHTRLTKDRYNTVAQMRNGNVTFMTNTRSPENIILSAYLQENRDRDVAAINGQDEMNKEIERYKEYVNGYPVHALYRYHGADVPLNHCPIEWVHENAMRAVAERYEIVVDLTRPEESASMVEAVTGLRPNFSQHFNERTRDTSGKMLTALKAVRTSHKTCGNELVHKVLKQQFNIIKDRMLQNRCFDEESGTFSLCDKSVLKKEQIVDRTREESYAQREALRRS